ncbi:MAG: Rpn family recombination-promoting nuclease/putative transposase [Magnetococcus sp. YQC-3]
MSDIAHPHDSLVRALLSDPEKAGALLRERLPKAISDLLSPEPLVLVEGSFVDEELRPHVTDRLFKAKTISGRVALLYCVIEHKSSPRRRTAWQLHKYMMRALEQWVRENKKWKLLPAIVPFVLYHGKRKWKVPTEFLALVDAEDEWRPYLLNFPYTVLDVGKIPDVELSRHPQLRAWLLVMKYAMLEGQQIMAKESLITMLMEVGDDFYIIIRYVVEVFQRYDEQTIREIIRRVRPEEEEKMMSMFAQDMLAKGRQDGLLAGEQKGEKKGEAKMLTRQLQRRFGDLPPWASQKIADAELSTLEEWSLRILDAKTLESVLADPS